MASGSISGSTNNRYIVAQINWQSYSNTDGNYSDVNAQLFYRRTNSGYTTSGTIAGNLNIDGTDYGYGGHVSIGSGWVQVASASKRVYHNNDGTRFIWIGASGGISGTSFTSTSCGSGVNLDTIPRASGMGLSTSTIAAGGSFMVNISPHSSGFSHWISITGVGDHITYEVAAGVTSCTCTIPKERVTTFPNSQSAQATVFLNTKTGSGHDTKIGVVSQAITVTVPSDVKPSLTAPTLTDSTKAYSVLNAFAANYSKVTVATTASVYKDDDFTDTATISSVTANYNGQNYDTSSGSFTFVPSTVGTSDMTITATDSRGKTATQTVSIPVAAYTRPTVTLSASRYSDSAGTTADDTGAYAKVTAVCTLDTDDVTSNSATVTLKYKTVDGTDWDTVDLGTITAGSTLSTVIPASDTKAYTLTTTIADKIATTGATMALSNGAVPMDFLKGGKGIAIGKTATREGLDIGWHMFGTGFLDSVYPVGAIYLSMNAISPAKLFGGSWERIYNCFLWAGAEWKTISTSESDTNTYTFTELTAARFGDPASNQWAYFDIPAGSYTRGQAVNLLNGLDPAWGVVKTLQVVDPEGTPEVGTTFGEAQHTLLPRELPNRTMFSLNTYGKEVAGSRWESISGDGYKGVVTYDLIVDKVSVESKYQKYKESYDAPHNNMPPAMIVNMWKRVS